MAALAALALATASSGHTLAARQPRPAVTSPLFTNAIAAQQSHARAWRNAPGIVGSGVGLTPAGQPEIEVFTTRPGVSVPSTVAGVRVQTVRTGLIVARSATLRYPR